MKHIAFVVYPGLTLLDLAGPLQVLSSMCERNREYGVVIVSKDGGAVDVDVPMKVVPGASFKNVLEPAVVVVPGGEAPTVKAMGDDELINYLKQVSVNAEYVCSVCTGSLILAAAGLLNGRQATTHWGCYKILEALGAKYVKRRWVQDEKFITSAGVSAGIDMALYLVSKLTDESTARNVQLGLEYEPEPPFGGIAWASVNRDRLTPYFRDRIKEYLADKPDIVDRVKGL
ncbi:TPA: DJ-1/PfpI family protein [Candidatus Bathyarchaeota archaeon]|nr:DJ-1/PfpI family protein [Candidatus Bathyarchaeota archaeon]